VRDPDAPSVPKSDAERAAYGARLVADAVARLDARPVRDPDHVPNIVVHPGDRLTVAVDPDGHADVRLTDCDGRCFAVLECDYRRADEYRVYAIRFAGEWHRHAHQHDASERTAVTAGHSRVPHDHAHGGAE
jgi:hypothetical protein